MPGATLPRMLGARGNGFGGSVSILRLLAAIGLVVAATSARAEPAPRQPLSIMTGVFGGAIEANGTLWFAGWTDGMSFFLSLIHI